MAALQRSGSKKTPLDRTRRHSFAGPRDLNHISDKRYVIRKVGYVCLFFYLDRILNTFKKLHFPYAKLLNYL